MHSTGLGYMSKRRDASCIVHGRFCRAMFNFKNKGVSMLAKNRFVYSDLHSSSHIHGLHNNVLLTTLLQAIGICLSDDIITTGLHLHLRHSTAYHMPCWGSGILELPSFVPVFFISLFIYRAR